MKYVMWGILIVSTVTLLYQLVINKQSGKWLTYVGMNIVLAAFLLYVINLLSPYTNFMLPINVTTLGTVGILGIPGLLLLSAVKLIIL